MKIEIFSAKGCQKCEASQAELREVAVNVVPGVEWRLVNVLDELEYAVNLGVLSLPSVVIDGVVLFTFLPTAKQLRTVLEKKAGSQ